MKIKVLLLALSAISLNVQAQTESSCPVARPAEGLSGVSLDSCRHMALNGNRQLMMSRQRITSADYQNEEAFTAYLPSIDFAGGYMYNQKKISIFGEDQYLPTKTFNLQTQSYEFNIVKNPLTGEPVTNPKTGEYIPETVALIPKEAMEYDIHNVFFGAITLTQPIYMGGKITALNHISSYAREVAREMNNSEAENVIYAVDAAYWQVVSLKAKYKLAKSYVDLLDSLDHNVEVMLQQGVATRSDKLSVDVKLNSARVDLIKVENGLALSRMALAQICGLPVHTTFTLRDEDISDISSVSVPSTNYNLDEVFSKRPDIRALSIGVDIAGEQVRLARSSMLPNVVMMGAYSFSNPNMFDGFRRRFSGNFSVGAMVTIPLWHWGGNYYKYKKAQSDEVVMRLQLDDAKDLASLQISQATYRAEESVRTFMMTRDNLASADENLRSANLAFREGMATADNVMEAQTAWLKANSENIDAMIDVYLCDTYLSKVLGNLVINPY